MSPPFVNPITTLILKVLYNIIVFSKNLGHYLSFEGSNIFVGTLEVGFLALQRKKINIWLHAEFHKYCSK